MYDPREGQMAELPEQLLAGGTRYHTRLRRRIGLALLSVVTATFAGVAVLAI